MGQREQRLLVRQLRRGSQAALGSRVALALGVVLALKVAAAPRSAPADSSKPSAPQASAAERIVEVELRLPPEVKPAGIPALVTLHQGDVLTRREVRRTIERLYLTGLFSDVVVHADEVPGGVRISIDLAAKRRIAAVTFEGNHVLSRAELLEAAKVAEGDEYFPERVQGAVEAIAQAHRRRGYGAAQISVELAELGTGLEVAFRIVEGPPTRIKAIEIAGGPGLPLEQIIDRLGLKVGDVLDKKKLAAGLERLKAEYRAARFFHARVGEPSFIEEPDGALVQLPISAGPRYAFHFHGNRAFPDQTLRQVLGYDGSETLDRVVIGRLARRLEGYYRYHGFHDVHVTFEDVRSPDNRAAILAFNIDEGRPIFVSRLVFEGNRRVRRDELVEVVVSFIEQRAPVQPGAIKSTDDPLDVEGRTRTFGAYEAHEPDPERVLLEDAYRDAADAMTQLYLERGFTRAKAQFVGVEVDVPSATAVARFAISEGPQAIIRDLAFRGAPKGVDLRAATPPQIGAPLSPTAIDRARSQLVRVLSHNGFIFARVSATAVLSEDARRASVSFVAEPGPQVRVGQVIIPGTHRTSEAVIRASIKVRSGDLLDPDLLFDSQRALLTLGIFRQASVQLSQPEVEETTKDVVVDLKERERFSLEYGPGYSLVDGPRFTADFVYPNLGGQGINLTGRGKLNYVGASSEAFQGLPGFQQNVQGLNGFGGRGNLALEWPHVYPLLPLEISGRLDAVGERVFKPSFRFARMALIPGLDWHAFGRLNVTLQYELEYDWVQTFSSIEQLLVNTANFVDLQRLRYPAGNFPLQSLRSTTSVDFRDDPATPHRGFFLSGTAELTGDLGAHLPNPDNLPLNCLSPHSSWTPESNERALCFPISTLKLSGNLTAYLPLPKGSVLALSARGGKIVFLSNNTNTIGPKRFFLGGATTLRGFHEDGLIPEDRRIAIAGERAACEQLANPAGCTPFAQGLISGQQIPSEGGQVFTLLKSELRIPLSGGFEVSVFAEAGNLWFDPTTVSVASLRFNTGAGLRYDTPIGPLAFDVGFNPFPDVQLNEPIYNLNFNIGVF